MVDMVDLKQTRELSKQILVNFVDAIGSDGKAFVSLNNCPITWGKPKMGGVGDALAARLIGEIGDVRRFHNAKSLIAYAGIDAPPYQSGKFTGTDRHISKRGSSTLRKVGFETMTCLVMQKKCGDPVYDFIKKKQAEGKACKVAKIAGFNKFLRIYYARVMEVYQ